MAAPDPVRLKVSALTPQAADDVANSGEDVVGAISIATLMGNDAGGDGKQFYGIHQTNATIADTTATTPNGATITFNAATNDILYNPIGSNTIQALPAGETLGDTFTYTIRLANGALSTAKVAVTVTGANDAATIGDVTDPGNDAAVTEDEATPTLTAAGILSIKDVDTGEASFKTAVTKAAGTLGDLTLAANGGYTYSVANGAVQSLGAGQIKAETFTVQALDGTTKQVSFTINGANDAPTILSGLTTATGSVTEATDGSADETGNVLHTAMGTITFSDVDLSDSHSVLSITPKGTGYLGSLTTGTVDQNNDSVGWTFSVNDAALDGLGAGQKVTQQYDAVISDGNGGTATQTIAIDLGGAADAQPVVRKTMDFSGLSTVTFSARFYSEEGLNLTGMSGQTLQHFHVSTTTDPATGQNNDVIVWGHFGASDRLKFDKADGSSFSAHEVDIIQNQSVGTAVFKGYNGTNEVGSLAVSAGTTDYVTFGPEFQNITRLDMWTGTVAGASSNRFSIDDLIWS